MIGRTLGRYRVLRKQGNDARGDCYVAEDTEHTRRVALQVLPAEPADAKGSPDGPEGYHRLRESIRAVAAISHPNVMSIDDFGEDEGVSYLVTELLEGQTLRERLQEGRLSPVEAVEYARQMAEGVSAAHRHGIRHLHLSPENVFLAESGKVKVLDFGLAETIQEPSATARGIGMMSYRSPEQAKGSSGDQRSDVFSFGAILYEMLSGEAAFGGDSVAQITAAILDKDPPKLSESTSLPLRLENIVQKCLKKSPDERFPSMQDVVLAIDELSEEKTTERPPVVDSDPSPRRKWKFFTSFIG